MQQRGVEISTFEKLLEELPMNDMNDTVAHSACNNQPGAGGTDFGHMGSGGAPSFLIATSTVQDGESQQSNPSDAKSKDFSISLLPLGDLIARIPVSLNQNKAADEEGVVFMIGGLLLDSSRYLVQKKGRTLHLTPKEFKLLHNLMIHAGKPVPHANLLRSVWGTRYGCDRGYLRIYVRTLRIKIEDDPSNPKYLLTEPYIGYRFAESIEEDSVISSDESMMDLGPALA
jgi:two-component system KDP operon response regulator KdpE